MKLVNTKELWKNMYDFEYCNKVFLYRSSRCVINYYNIKNNASEIHQFVVQILATCFDLLVQHQALLYESLPLNAACIIRDPSYCLQNIECFVSLDCDTKHSIFFKQ
jgi:hypothetical protein